MQADMSKAGKKRLTRSIRIIKTAAAAKYNAPSTAFSHGLLVKSADALRKIQKPPARRKKIGAVVKIGYVVMVYEFVRKHIHMNHEGQHKGA